MALVAFKDVPTSGHVNPIERIPVSGSSRRLHESKLPFWRLIGAPQLTYYAIGSRPMARRPVNRCCFFAGMG